MPMLTMIGFFISFESFSYWYIHMCPYWAIMLVYNSSNISNNVLFETVALIAMTLSNYGSRPWAFEIYGYSGMFLEKIFGSYNNVGEPYMLQNFCADVSIIKYVGALNVVFFTLMVTFVYMNLPQKIKYEDAIAIRGWAYFRLILNVLVCYIPLLLFVYKLLYL